MYEDAQSEEREPENYKDFLAPEDGNNAQIKIRFPDGSFDQISFPASSQIKVGGRQDAASSNGTNGLLSNLSNLSSLLALSHRLYFYTSHRRVTT